MQTFPYWRIPALIAGCVLLIGCTEPNEYQPPPPPPVTVANPVVQDVTIYIEENGQTESVDRAEVRARVQGFLEEIKFQPGSDVSEGDVLYQIEQIQYQASLDSAQASLAGAQARLATAQAGIALADAGLVAAEADLNVKQLDLNRLDGLLASNAIPQRDWDDAKAQRDSARAAQDGAIAQQQEAKAAVEVAKAAVQQAQAELNQAQINLDYTVVKAPISGRITRTDVKRGNLVENGTLLATIVRNNPIWANFSISERDLLRLQRTKAPERQEDFDISEIPAKLQRSGDVGFPFSGNLDYVDPEVDQSTGTLAIRALFQNPPDQPAIVPGLFVRVRVPIGTLQDAVLIPELAIARDQVGAYVLVLGEGNIVERRNVELGPKQDELIVVSNGLAPDDLVVVVGLQRARPGSEVNATETTLSPGASTVDGSDAASE